MKIRHVIFLAMALGIIIGVATGRWEGFLLGAVPFAISISFLAFPTYWINLGFSFALIPLAVVGHNHFDLRMWVSESFAMAGLMSGITILAIVFLFWKNQPDSRHRLSFTEAYLSIRDAIKEGIRSSLGKEPVYLFPREENLKNSIIHTLDSLSGEEIEEVYDFIFAMQSEKTRKEALVELDNNPPRRERSLPAE